MSELIYTTEQLIAAVRRRGRLPNVQIPGTADEDIIQTLTESLRAYLMPGVMKVQEDYFTRVERTTITTTKLTYRIPQRASGLKLREVAIVGSDGSRRLLDRVWRQEIGKYTATGDSPSGFVLEGSSIRLLGCTTVAAGSIEFVFFARPGDLVKAADYRQVVSVDSTTEITLDSEAPTSWTTELYYDVHSGLSGGELKVYRRTASEVSGTSVTFDTEIDGSIFGDMEVEVGDYFCITGTAAVPALPTELHVPLLLKAAAALTMPINPELSAGLTNEYREAMMFAGYLVDKRLETPAPLAGKQVNPLYGASKSKMFGGS